MSDPIPAARPELTELSPPAQAGAAPLDALLDMALPVIIEIGRAQMTIQDVLQLGAGSVIPLDRMVGEPVDIYVSDRRLAQGEVVVMGDHFAVRVTRVLPAQGGEAAA
jgi:flagellar motor switch protein FliN/FliY